MKQLDLNLLYSHVSICLAGSDDKTNLHLTLVNDHPGLVCSKPPQILQYYTLHISLSVNEMLSMAARGSIPIRTGTLF